MAYNYEYPYTDPSRYNDDWLLNKMKELDINLSELEQRAVAEATAEAKAYLDTQIADLRAEFEEVKAEVNTAITTLRSDYEAFVRLTDAHIRIIQTRVEQLSETIDADIKAVNARTDLAIAQNNEYILEELSKSGQSIKVVNMFTGARVTIQDMFNYLGGLHTEDGATINYVVSADKTVDEIVLIDADCTDWVLHGRTLLA